MSSIGTFHERMILMFFWRGMHDSATGAGIQKGVLCFGFSGNLVTLGALTGPPSGKPRAGARDAHHGLVASTVVSYRGIRILSWFLLIRAGRMLVSGKSKRMTTIGEP